ncbi:MAG TPA: Sec-independent protein translocase protein TatB [Gallionellaceae bacterium]|nr:Sec-independent protein translocase protein TatB [Gallionellaceae bacterium]
MFGIDFPELVVIAVVALIVIGPEHLPKVARTVGHLWGRAQRYVNSVKADMSRDMALEELRKVQQQAQQVASDLGQSIHQAAQDVSAQVAELESEVTSSKYGVGQSIPESELAAKILPREELLKSEMPKTETAKSDMPDSKVPRHIIVEEHHAVLPVSSEQKKTTNT